MVDGQMNGRSVISKPFKYIVKTSIFELIMLNHGE